MAAPASEQIIRQMFATFTDFRTSLDQLKAFLTSDYQQIVDGRTLTLNDFLTHAQALREALQSLEITVERIICQEDMAATVHVARATRPSGHISTIRVIAFFQLREGRIALVDEFTHVLEGNIEDKTLGSLQ